MTNLTIGPGGAMTLPGDVCDRYGLTPETPIRVIEMRHGILLVPLSAEPMSAELAEELRQWQDLSIATWELFPYEDQDS